MSIGLWDLYDDPLPGLAEFAEHLGEVFPKERRVRHVVYADTKPTLQELGGKYRLGLITNGASDLQREKIEGSGVGRYFDSITISGDVGICKPDPKIFMSALDSLGARPETTLMVGNSLKSDIAAAQAVGLRAIWVNRSDSSYDGDIKPDAEIGSLSEIHALIEKL